MKLNVEFLNKEIQIVNVSNYNEYEIESVVRMQKVVNILQMTLFLWHTLVNVSGGLSRCWQFSVDKITVNEWSPFKIQSLANELHKNFFWNSSLPVCFGKLLDFIIARLHEQGISYTCNMSTVTFYIVLLQLCKTFPF